MQNEENKDGLPVGICQSCGMPMTVSDHFGTRADGTAEKEYCCFCFKKGAFTDHLSVYEFAIQNIPAAGKDADVEGVSNNGYGEVLEETVKLQKLKRWHTHAIHQEYYSSVYRVLAYINQNIANNIDLDQLSKVANISKYHFHRIFKAMLNESPGEYIQRLKLEKAAFKLHTSKLSLKEVAGQVGYEKAEALSKVFKKRYQLTPTQFRNTPSDLTVPLVKPAIDLGVAPEIRTIMEKQILCAPVQKAYTAKNAFSTAWNSLLGFVNKKKLSESIGGYYCISQDISTHTSPDKCRIYVGVELLQPIHPYGRYNMQPLAGGKYAVFTYNGPYKDLDAFYCNIYRYWIPKNPFILRDSLHFEKYAGDSPETKGNELSIEIYIPVERNVEKTPC